MDTTLERLIELLNMDLELEYSAAIQYINHAAVMTGAAYGDIIKELKIHANEEIQHAMTLADQIDYLGGSPSVSVGKILTSEDNNQMLGQDLDGEEDAIRRYKVRVEQAEQLKEKGVIVVAIQASEVNESTLTEWVKEYNIPFPVGMVADDAEKTRFAWGVRSLPWLILTDKHHIVRAEGFGLDEIGDRLESADNVGDK